MDTESTPNLCKPPEQKKAEVTQLLKITTIRESGSTILKLEGKLSGPWTKELERVWTDNAQHGSVAVDLSNVSFVSPEGRQLLKSMNRQRVELRSHSLLTQFIISQIRNTSDGNCSTRDGGENGITR